MKACEEYGSVIISSSLFKQRFVAYYCRSPFFDYDQTDIGERAYKELLDSKPNLIGIPEDFAQDAIDAFLTNT